MKIQELKPGDLLMLKKSKSLVHRYLEENFGTWVEELLTRLTGQEYVHCELYLGEGYVLTATPSGIRIGKYSTDTLLEYFDFYRPKFPIDEEGLKRSVREYHNSPYDFVSMYLGIVNTLFELFGVELKVPYDTKFAFMCSELVARIYEQMGVTFRKSPEFITPQNLVDTGKFIKL